MESLYPIPAPRNPAPPIPFPTAQHEPKRTAADYDRDWREAHPHEERRPSPPFAMIPHAVVDDYLAKAGPTAWAVFQALARHADAERRCFPSLDTLCKLTGIKTRDTVASALSRLVELGMIAREHRRTEAGAQTSNAYVLLVLGPVEKFDTPVENSIPPQGYRNRQEVNVEEVDRERPPLSPTGRTTKRTNGAIAWPPGFTLTDDLRRYAVEKAGIYPERVDAVFEGFHNKALAKGYKYVDWARAWQNWVMSSYQDRDRIPGYLNGKAPGSSRWAEGGI